MISIFNNQNFDEFETLQQARKDLVGEIEAIMQYDEHIHSSNSLIAKQTWENIRNEELTHVGELLALINHLNPLQKPFVQNGIDEFNERINKK